MPPVRGSAAPRRPRARRGPARVALLAVALALGGMLGSCAQWSTVHEQFYLQASHNWAFRDRYASADRLFNAFDYGHAILYETLWTQPGAPASLLEEREYEFLTQHLLVEPPRLPLEEGAIEIAYARLAPEAKAMFEWAHVLHRQMYDVLADERLSDAARDAEVARLLAYYRSRPEVAFSSRPKSMELMEGQPYSLAFRRRYPKFNGLIWAYHWLQVGLYEPLLVGGSVEQKQALVRATVSRFWQMLEQPVESMPGVMPMTAAVAPTFARRYPDAAIIFDNLHSMHDVISDILANPEVPRGRKRAEILRAAHLFRDDTSYIMSVDAWRAMALDMGLDAMGGPAVGFGTQVGRAQRPADEHAGHVAPGATPAQPDSALLAALMEMPSRMLADTLVRRRVLADTALRRMLIDLLPRLPMDRRAQLGRMLRDTLPDPHAGHRMPAPPPSRRR